MLSKLMGLATVGGAWANATLIHRFLSGITTVVMLTVISALLCSFVLLGAFGAMYFGLIHYGLDPYAAAITVAGFMIILTTISVALTVSRLRQLRQIPIPHGGVSEIPGLAQVSSIADAFMQGLSSGRSTGPKKAARG